MQSLYQTMTFQYNLLLEHYRTLRMFFFVETIWSRRILEFYSIQYELRPIALELIIQRVTIRNELILKLI